MTDPGLRPTGPSPSPPPSPAGRGTPTPIHQFPPTSEPTQPQPNEKVQTNTTTIRPRRQPDDDATPRQLRRRPPESVFGRGRRRQPQIGAAQHQSTHSHPRPKSDRRTIEPTTDGNDRTEAIPPRPNVAGRPTSEPEPEEEEPDQHETGGGKAKQSNARERYIPCLSFHKMMIVRFVSPEGPAKLRNRHVSEPSIVPKCEAGGLRREAAGVLFQSNESHLSTAVERVVMIKMM